MAVYVFCIFLFFIHAYSIRIQVKPEIFARFSPFTRHLNFSKDWSDECDVPCVWTGSPDRVDGVFYLIKNNWDANWAFEDEKVVPITIGGSTEGEHYHDLLSLRTFRKHFTASALLDTRSDIPWQIKLSSYEDIQKVPRIVNPIKKAVTALYNCASTNNREGTTLEISKIVPTDIVGNCMNNSPWPLCVDLPCEKEDVLKRYMFCLAFENGITPRYATEKIHQCLQAGSLPVYYGTAHISRLVPKGSYLDMRDFESPTLLANYMLQLMENETLYDGYFEWKKHPLDPDFVRRNKPLWDYKVQCRVCRYVWVKQRGLVWDRVTQNATMYMETSLDLDQDPYYVEEMEILLSNSSEILQFQGILEFCTILFSFCLLLLLFYRCLLKFKLHIKYSA